MDCSGEKAMYLYSCAQKLISLCGWEPRWSPDVLDCEEQSAQSAKNDYSSAQTKDVTQDLSLSRKDLSTSSRKDTGNNEKLGSEFKSESRSPLLDCSLCGVTVRVWDFVTVPRPVNFALGSIDTPQMSKKMAPTCGVSAASGINGLAAADGMDKEQTEENDEVATLDKRWPIINSGVDLNLTTSGGMSNSNLNMPSMSDRVRDAGEGRSIIVRRPAVSEVGDWVASYESEGPINHKRSLEECGSTVDRPRLRMQQANGGEGNVVDHGNSEFNVAQQSAAGPSKHAHNSIVSEALPGFSLDILEEARGNRCDQFNQGNDQVIGVLSTRESIHASSIIAMDTICDSPDDSMESVENFPGNANDLTSPSFDMNETSDLNCSFQAQQSTCFQPVSERVTGETGVSSTIAGEEVINTETVTQHARDGPSIGINGGSVGMGASHEAEVHGTAISVNRVDSVEEDEPVAELVENQGQNGEFAPCHRLIGHCITEEMNQEDRQCDSQFLVSHTAGRADSGSKIVVSTRVESVESGDKTCNMQALTLENSAHPSISCNAVVCYAYETSKEEVTQTGKELPPDDSAHLDSGYLSVDGAVTPNRESNDGRVEFDPIKLHNEYCPWVNGVVAAAACGNSDSSSKASGYALSGWQLTLDALDLFQSLRHLPVQTVESESAASLCKGEHLTPNRKLLARHSFIKSRGKN